MTFPATVSSVSSSRCQAHGLSLPIGLPSPGCAGCPGRRRGSGWGATSATRATSSICQWDSWRLPDMENVQETRHAIGVTSILSDFMFCLLIFFSSTSALFVPIQRAFSTGFQYLFPCHTSTFSAKSGAMAAALADWRMDIFGGLPEQNLQNIQLWHVFALSKEFPVSFRLWFSVIMPWIHNGHLSPMPAAAKACRLLWKLAASAAQAEMVWQTWLPRLLMYRRPMLNNIK